MPNSVMCAFGDSMEIEYQICNRKITVMCCLVVLWGQNTKWDSFGLFLFSWHNTY